jgi:hypothetical protein
MSLEYPVGKENKFSARAIELSWAETQLACKAFALERGAFAFGTQDGVVSSCASLVLTVRWHSQAAACNASMFRISICPRL